MAMKDTFYIGRRFSKIKYLCVLVNSLVVLSFYFIYHYLLEGFFPEFVGGPLVLIFIGIGFAVARVTLWAANKYSSSVSYRLLEDGLLETLGKTQHLYRWKDFRSVRLRHYQFQSCFPVEFQIGERTLVLNQYIEGLCQLTSQIFVRISDYVDIDPALERQAADLTGVY